MLKSPLVLAGWLLLSASAMAETAPPPATTAPPPEPHALMCVPLPPPPDATAIESPPSKPCALTSPAPGAGEPCTCGPIVGKVEDIPQKVPLN